MKHFLTITIVLLLLKGNSSAQTLNQLTILPANPTATDTILVISDFSYMGGCAYGMIYYWSDTVNSTINIYPTYCGYGDTTLCNSIDTVKVGPFPGRNYTLRMEYHQGLCPVSNFDATLYRMDTSLAISPANSVATVANKDLSFSVHPNPAKGNIVLRSKGAYGQESYRLKIQNVLGQQVFQTGISNRELSLDASRWGGAGIYFLSVIDGKENPVHTQKVVVE